MVQPAEPALLPIECLIFSTSCLSLSLIGYLKGRGNATLSNLHPLTSVFRRTKVEMAETIFIAKTEIHIAFMDNLFS